MRRLRSFMSNVVIVMTRSNDTFPAVVGAPVTRTLTDGGEVPFPAQNVLDRAMLPDREHDDRHMIFLGKRERRRIHDFQAPIQRLLMVEMLEPGGFRILLGIGSI